MCRLRILVSSRFAFRSINRFVPSAWVMLLSCAVPLSAGGNLHAADPPASPQQAAAVIDLSSFELTRPIETDGVLHRRIAGQSYIASGSVAEIARAIKDRLTKAGWRLLDGSMVTDQYASETFQRSGFTLSLSVSPSGKRNEVRVTLMNHGNVDFRQLPLPIELVPQYQSAVMSMLGSPWSVEETSEKITQALVGAGWKPYGSPVGSRQFKQNGVRLNVSIGAAPAQDNRTVVQVTSDQMSADVPALDGAESVQYSDSTRSVSFNHPASLSEVLAAVRALLESDGWIATTETPIKISFRDHLIFRNQDKEMMEVMCHEIDGKTRTRIDFRTAADVEALNQAVEAEAARRKAEIAKQAVKEMIVITKPPGSEITETGDSKIEFSLPPGKALSSLEAWIPALEKQGWKRTTNVREKLAVDLMLSKGDVELHVTYVDPGFIPATIDLSVFGKATIRIKQ